MLKAAKQGVLSFAKRTGAFDLMIRSGFRGDRLLVLAYHGVAMEDEHKWNSSLYVTQKFLRRRFELLNDNGCTVLALGEAIDRLYSSSLPQRAVAITFDDGGYNFFAKALPVVSEFEFPVTVYLTTYYSVFNRPVFPVAADYLLWKARGNSIDLRDLVGGNGRFDLSSISSRKAARDQIVSFGGTRSLSAREKDDLLAELARRLSIDYQEFCDARLMSLMDQSEVSSISRAGVDIQLHTHRHRVPSEKNTFLKEIRDNADVIRSTTGRSPSHLCYPSGEYSSLMFPWLREANIASATTCETALVGTGTERFAIPRLVDTAHLSEVEFEGWLAGVSHFLPQRTAARAA